MITIKISYRQQFKQNMAQSLLQLDTFQPDKHT